MVEWQTIRCEYGAAIGTKQIPQQRMSAQIVGLASNQRADNETAIALYQTHTTHRVSTADGVRKLRN